MISIYNLKIYIYQKKIFKIFLKNKNKMSENVKNYIFLLEEVYSLEDYANFTMIKGSIQNNNIFDDQNLNANNYKNFVRLNFLIGEKGKEFIMKISDLKKVYAFIKIYYNNYHLNLFLHSSNVYDPNDILNRMNNKYFKGAIGVNLKIKDFPLINYLLQEAQQKDDFADKVFYLIKMSGKMNSGLIDKNFNDTQIVLKLKNLNEINNYNNFNLNGKNQIESRNSKSTNITINNNVNNNFSMNNNMPTNNISINNNM